MSILLKNGVALLHDADDHVVPTQTSILIQDGKIAKIGRDIEQHEDVEVIDCTDKIISPGFIDTHHHGWQTQLKGRHANELLFTYMASGNAQSFQYSPTATYYGQLAGMLEAINCGTTTVLDHAHMTYSPAHAHHAISATASSGIRSIFCYAPIMRMQSFNPLTPHPNPMEDWVMQTFSSLAAQGPWGNSRVTLGFAFDLFFLPPSMLQDIFAKVAEAGTKTITAHYVCLPQLGGKYYQSLPQNLQDLGLLDSRWVFSHANGCEKQHIDLIKSAGAHISSTPSTELSMAMGRSLCFDASFASPDKPCPGAQDIASLGVDCHSFNSGSVVDEARLGLHNARSHYNEHFLSTFTTTRVLPNSLSVEAAFNLATIKGAKALRLEKEIGRIAVGMKADFAIFDALSPSLVAAAQQDPVAAIILHSSPADVEIVVVDGVVRKRGGKLVAVGVDKEIVGKERLEWSEIAREVVRSREEIQAEIEKIDFGELESSLMKMFHLDERVFVKGV
ncbi:Metallo-dependent hydrolase [Amniculicola lignicola CBS 123094]|uniref:Metallo-dependent hydrolase n=1 Tax=Amniculicola lignicola CBS 123094 TaxID=1392246 RepID=A0A6A5W9L9_9PLEO|nr:Metallo-dependent hydrolase [Amniculicola lignicola CBS 123094]